MKSINLLVAVCCSVSMMQTVRAQTLHTFLPATADPLVTKDNDANYAYVDSAATGLHKLFLFFPGTGGTPAGYTYILRTAASLGYNALGLSYVNDTTVNTLCAGQSDSCAGFERMEVFWGKDYSPVIQVDSADGIKARLISALRYLSANYPAENWGQFLFNSDSILWNTVCVSGHSQGAGMASIIAYWFAVNRGVFFATGGDVSQAADNVALWMEQPSVTPALHKYAFTHRQDELFWGPNDYAPVIWDTLGLFDYGMYVNFDTLAGNYYGRHCFTSTDTINSSNPSIYHGCVVADGATPITGNLPYFLPLWKYMLTDTSTSDTATATGIVLPLSAQQTCSIYPNPCQGQFFVQSAGGQPGGLLTVTDITGKVIFKSFVPANGTSNVNIGGVTAGIYFITLNGVTQKLQITNL